MGECKEQCVPNLGLELAHWPPDVVTYVDSKLVDTGVINAIMGTISSNGQTKKKVIWLQFFVTHIIGSSMIVPGIQRNRIETVIDDDDG